jgi:Xaa-Pro aminopeptidase
MTASVECIQPAEFASRRDRILQTLDNAVGLVMAGDLGHGDGVFRPNADFEYLTGVTDESGAMLLLDPTNPVETRRSMLFLKPLNRERERWDGYRPEISASLREALGIEAIFRTDTLPRTLNTAVRRSRRMACLHTPSVYTQRVSLDLTIFRKVAERIPGAAIEDRTESLATMRSVKSPQEVALIQHAIDITSVGFEAMMRFAGPGVGEYEVQESIEHAYRGQGSRSSAFATIVGSGINSTVLHYVANNQTLTDGDLVCVDSGAVFGGYAADVTRTVPVSGRFSKRQREIYELVLEAETAAIEAIKPGVTFAELDDAARSVIIGAGYGDYFIHSIGHHLGLETHDATPDGPLQAGAVVTIEPGIYIPDEKIGVRIEDDVLVTETGSKNLSAGIPKSLADVEEAMKESH